MAMATKEFESLAKMIAAQVNRENRYPGNVQRPFTYGQINELMDWAVSCNPKFDKRKFNARLTELIENAFSAPAPQRLWGESRR
jgi:hypothetical protein